MTSLLSNFISRKKIIPFCEAQTCKNNLAAKVSSHLTLKLKKKKIAR